MRTWAGLVLRGSPDTVRRQLEEQVEEIGLRQVCLLFAFGNLPQDTVMRSMRAFAAKVMPGSANESHSTVPSRPPPQDGPSGTIEYESIHSGGTK